MKIAIPPKWIGTVTGRWSNRGFEYYPCPPHRDALNRQWRKWCVITQEKQQQRVARGRRSVMLAIAGYDKRMTMPRALAIETLVRRKNQVYAKWRSEHSFNAIDTACTECMIRFGELPNWEEFVRANRTMNWQRATVIAREHAAWKREVRAWALERKITRHPMQSAQFLKFYFAWWRYEYEKRNGAIERTYARQMG